ncbi:hypothetical protein PQX77_015205 [Marasmius sp. AFHP31]|nr:hypothetical protein PQX77_015205 [Marasmius sp. AFHP31]
MSSILANAQNVSIGDHVNLQAVARDAITNHNHYYNTERGDFMTVNGRTIRRVIDGDVILRRLILSKILSISIKPEGPTTSTESQVFKVKKTVQTARLHGHQGKYTAITFELVDQKDRNKFVKLVKNVLEAAICQRSALLTQIFAVAESNGLTVIVHDELADGEEFLDRDWNSWIVFYYLTYALMVTMESLHDDETVRFPVPNRWEGWLFNVKSLTWQFDLASVLLNPPSKDNLEPSLNPLTPLRQETLPRLHTTAKIIACVEENFGDALHLVVSYGHGWICDLSDFAQDGLLTFGAVINWTKRGILAHLPSIPSPKWFCKSISPDVKVNFSSSVPWRVDLAFCKNGNVQVTLDFGLCIPRKHRNQLGCAYLCQSLRFLDNPDDVEDVVFIDQIGFRLEGAFHENPTTCSTPAYLFVLPFPTEYINNTHCIRLPLLKNPFYWSHNLKGRSAINQEDWEKFGIPKLSVQKWIGSSWKKHCYAFVQDHLCSGGYELDGKQYARNHGYPKLIHANHHDDAIGEFICLDDSEDSDSEWSDTGPETSNSDSEYSDSDHEVLPSRSLLLPSPSSLAEAPLKCDTEHEDSEPAQPVTHWAKPVFIKWYNSVLETLAKADALNHSIVAC